MGPFALVFLFVFIVPLVYAIYTSFFQSRLVGGEVFVGWDNYARLMKDAQFWSGVGRVVQFTVIQVPIMLILAAAFALALDSLRLHGMRFFRVAVFLPYTIPAVVATLMWGFIYGSKYGLVGNINDLFGWNLDLLDHNVILLSLTNIVTWEFTGYNTIIFFAALTTIPRSLYEAAAIDGANEFRVIRAIKLPELKGSLVITIIFSIIGSFQLFNEPQILQAMVPGNTITTYFTPNMYAYNLSFLGGQANYAAALAIVMALLTMAVAYLVQWRSLRGQMK